MGLWYKEAVAGMILLAVNCLDVGEWGKVNLSNDDQDIDLSGGGERGESRKDSGVGGSDRRRDEYGDYYYYRVEDEYGQSDDRDINRDRKGGDEGE